MLIALTDTHRDHHAIGHAAKRHPGYRAHFDAAEQHRRANIQGPSLRRFNNNAQAIEIAGVGNGRFLKLKAATPRPTPRLHVDIGLQDGVEILDARCRDLRRHHREPRTRARKGIHIFRIEHRRRLHFVAIGDELERFDLADIDAEVADRHVRCQLAGIKRVQSDLAAHRAGGGF